MGLFKKKKSGKKNLSDNVVQTEQSEFLGDNVALMTPVDTSNSVSQSSDTSTNSDSNSYGAVQSTTFQSTTTTTNDNFSNLSGIKKREKAVEFNKLYPFRYKAKKENGKKVSSLIEAESIDDARVFLERQGYHDIVLAPKGKFDVEINIGSRLKVGDLAFDLTQLSTYIKAGIPLVDSVGILAKQSNKYSQKRAYEKLLYDLLKGDNLSTAMDKQPETFPQLLVNMVRSAEMTGDLATILDDMSEYYESMEQTRKAMRSALTYPLLVLVISVGVLVFMLVYLVPQFVGLYEEQGANLPTITTLVINASNFVKTYYLWILGVVVLLVGAFIIVYKKSPKFKQIVQIIIMRIPVVGNIVIYNEVYNFTKTFASLINHGVFITDCMEILSKITSNEVYKGIIANTMNNLSKGESISVSFRGEWAFPEVAYHMIVTGENTGQLGLMMEKVSDHYQALHKSLIDQLKGLIEPIMILAVSGIVGIILLSIITPMFGIYGQLQ